MRALLFFTAIFPSVVLARFNEWQEYSRYDDYGGGGNDGFGVLLLLFFIGFGVVPYLIYKKRGSDAVGVYIVASPFIFGAGIFTLAALRDGNIFLLACVVGVVAWIAHWWFKKNDTNA